MFARTICAAALIVAPAVAQAAADQTLGMALMGASVAGDEGTLRSGAGANSVTRHGVGRYTVWFDRDLAGCFITSNVISAGAADFGVFVNANKDPYSPRGVDVYVRDGNGDFIDGTFDLIVFCAR